MRERIQFVISRAKYAAIGGAIGGAAGGLFGRNAASTGAAIGALAGAIVGEKRVAVTSFVSEVKERKSAVPVLQSR